MERSSADGHHPSLETEVSSPTLLSGLGRTPSGCPSDSKYKCLKDRFCVSSHRLGFQVQSLISIQRTTQLCVHASQPSQSHAEFSSMLFKYFGGSAVLPDCAVGYERPGGARKECPPGPRT